MFRVLCKIQRGFLKPLEPPPSYAPALQGDMVVTDLSKVGDLFVTEISTG